VLRPSLPAGGGRPRPGPSPVSRRS
jgi:hypothetical protein